MPAVGNWPHVGADLGEENRDRGSRKAPAHSFSRSVASRKGASAASIRPSKAAIVASQLLDGLEMLIDQEAMMLAARVRGAHPKSPSCRAPKVSPDRFRPPRSLSECAALKGRGCP